MIASALIYGRGGALSRYGGYCPGGFKIAFKVKKTPFIEKGDPMRLFIFVVFFVTVANIAVASPSEDAKFNSQVIEGCRLVANGKFPKSQTAIMHWGYCIGALSSFYILSTHLQPNMRSCKPQAVTLQQAIKVFLKFSDTHPELEHHGFEVLAIEAFKSAWPCPAN